MSEEKKPFLILLLTMTFLVLLVGAITIATLYDVAFEQARARLIESVQSQSRLIEAVARFDSTESLDYTDGSAAATVSQIREAYKNYKGFGETGEFMMARRGGNNIVFVIRHRNYRLDEPPPVPFGAAQAAPMRRALLNESGSMIGLDYHNVLVLAAYEPVGILNMGIVSKINISEIRAPFIKGSGFLLVITLILLGIGAFIFRKVSIPIIHRMKSHVQELEVALHKEKEYNSLQEKFVALVSHEFRTPLAIIDGSAQRIIRRKDRLEPDELETRTSKIRDAVKRMIDLIDSTLFVSRLDAGKVELQLEPCKIGEIVTEISQRHAEISPAHQIKLDLDKLPKETTADPRLLDQVFSNLLSNAIKFAPNAPLINVTGWTEGSDIFITVTDHGVGISADDLPKMFKRFFRAKSSEGIAGIGLGLNICKEFMQMHYGDLTVSSIEGEGTTFTTRLPITN